MTAGNVMASTNKHNTSHGLFRYCSSWVHAGTLAVAGESIEIADKSVSAIVTYLAIYAAMNLGAFAIILSVARTTRSSQIESYNGLFKTSPSLAIMMTIFLASLAGVPPLGGWFAKFSVFTSLTSADTSWGYGLAVIAAINAVIAFGYYGRIAMKMWVEDPQLPYI